MKTFVALVIGVKVVISVKNCKFSRIFKWMLHVAQCIEYASQSPCIYTVVNFAIVPSVQHLWGSVHRSSKLGQLKVKQMLVKTINKVK